MVRFTRPGPRLLSRDRNGHVISILLRCLHDLVRQKSRPCLKSFAARPQGPAFRPIQSDRKRVPKLCRMARSFFRNTERILLECQGTGSR